MLLKVHNAKNCLQNLYSIKVNLDIVNILVYIHSHLKEYWYFKFLDSLIFYSGVLYFENFQTKV